VKTFFIFIFCGDTAKSYSGKFFCFPPPKNVFVSYGYACLCQWYFS